MNFKVDHNFPALGKKQFALNARRLYQHSKGTYYVLMLFEDVTG